MPEESKTNKSFLPFIRGGLRRGDSSFETPIIKVFQKKKDSTSSPSLPLNEGKGVCAFTLAETMIVLVILGVVAAITVPALVRNQMEAQNRTRLRKAMTVYDMAINKMVVENNFKSNTALTDWGNGNNCVNTRAYFKSAQDGANNCIFRASDGVWWDISDITRPIIDLRNGNFNGPSTRFQLFAHFGNNGELRVDDIQYDMANVQTDNYIQQSDVDNLTALYDYVNNKKTEEDTRTDFQKNCVSINDTQCKIGDTIYTKKTIEKTEVNRFVWGDELCIWTKEDGQKCPYTSTAQAGDLYFTEPTYDYSSYRDSNSSDCEECKEYGWDDYYNAAKRYCEDKGGRLPTIAELQAGGYTSGFFGASEQYDSNSALVLSNGDVYYNVKDYESAVVCVGK